MFSHNKGIKITDEEMIITREMGSFTSLVFIFIPLVSLSTGSHGFTTGYDMFGKGLGSFEQFFALAGIGLNLHLS